jgi:N-acetylmuramoyl-L-alanine amidase
VSRAGAGRRARHVAAAAIVLALALPVTFPLVRAAERAPDQLEETDSVPVTMLGGTPYLGVNDLARLLDATKFWRADVRKLVLRNGRHAITFTVDNPFVVLDERILWLPSPVRSLRGELQIPAAFVDSLPPDSSIGRLLFDAPRARVVVLPASGQVGSPVVTVTAATTRIAFPADRPEDAIVVARSRARLRLRLSGLFTGVTPDSIAPGGLLRALRAIPAAGGSAFEFEIGHDARGFRLIQDAAGHRVALELMSAAGPGVEPFAPEGPTGPRSIRVVVLDPGHGGSDRGVVAGGTSEKDLTLALAFLLRPELERRLGARVVLTRSDDRNLTAERRAEIANRARADLVLAIHFDGVPATAAHGATAYCPPSTFADAIEAEGRGGAQPIQPLPWRDVAVRHAVESRTLAEAILGVLELHGQGPTRVRELMPTALLGVNAPGLLLECATLTAEADRTRVTGESGLRELAGSIAGGIIAWQRNE